MSPERPSRGRAPSLTELVAVLLSVGCLAGAWQLLQAARRKADPRMAMIDRIRRDATTRDLIVLPEESLELAHRASPVPVLWGAVALTDLTGLRRLYAITPSHTALFGYQARLGPGRSLDASTMVWELTDLAHVVFDITAELGQRVSARRVGGVHNGDCPLNANGLICNGEPWNHLHVETHRFDGAELNCLFAHPQADGRLVLTLRDLPVMHAFVGAAGIDDAGQHPGGAPVHMDIHFAGTGGASADQRVSTSDARGVFPFRMIVPKQPGSATLTITTPNAGARQFCFTLYGTE